MLSHGHLNRTEYAVEFSSGYRGRPVCVDGFSFWYGMSTTCNTDPTKCTENI